MLRPMKSTKFSRFTMRLKTRVALCCFHLLVSLVLILTVRLSVTDLLPIQRQYQPNGINVLLGHPCEMHAVNSIVLSIRLELRSSLVCTYLSCGEWSSLSKIRVRPLYLTDSCGYPCRVHIIYHMYSTNMRVTLHCKWNVRTPSGLSIDG